MCLCVFFCRNGSRRTAHKPLHPSLSLHFLSFFFFLLKKLCIYLFKTVHAVQARRGGHKHSVHMNQKHVAGFSILSVPQHETFLKNFFTIEHAQCTKLFNMCCPLYSFIKQPPFDFFFFFCFSCFYSNLFQQIGVQKKVKNQVFICKCLKEILASLCLFMFEYLKLFFFFW